jgi:hypothetical protein
MGMGLGIGLRMGLGIRMAPKLGTGPDQSDIHTGEGGRGRFRSKDAFFVSKDAFFGSKDACGRRGGDQ